MKKRIVAVTVLLALMVAGPGHARRASVAASVAASRVPDSVTVGTATGDLHSIIHRHLGRPYVWGSTGLKSYDCSGFVWRVMQENGIHIKRTTARKYYMTLPKVTDEDQWTFGNVVFFDRLKHCGIVASPDSFYHSSVTMGTHRTRFDPLWRGKISGVRAMPRHEPAGAEAR